VGAGLSRRTIAVEAEDGLRRSAGGMAQGREGGLTEVSENLANWLGIGEEGD